MANQANNARSIRSRKALADALIELLRKKDLAHITVRQVCELAAVTRSTFYVHYESIDSLLKAIERSLEAGLPPYFDSRDTQRMGQDVHLPYLSSYRWYEYCLENAASLRAILGPHGDPGFEHRLRRRLRDEISEMMDFDRMPQDEQRRFVVDYTISAILSLLHSILEDETSLTPQQVTLIANIVREGPILMNKAADRSATGQPDDCCFKTVRGVFNYRVGAIILRDGKILMATNNRDPYYYSVGGRVRFGETTEAALQRELTEEIGVDCIIGKLALVHENLFEERGVKYHELALFYRVDLPADANLRIEQVTESGLIEKFAWLPIDDLEGLTVFPEILKSEIHRLQQEVLHVATNGW